MANPFPYQRPVLPAQVIDRDAETGTLLDWLPLSGMGGS